jgi:DNA-directed RNA polymerase specialized sigma24 family protein
VAADEDERLVREFLDHGRVEVFETLVRRHQRRVCRITMSVLGPGHQVQAEDVAQEVFLDVFRKFGGLERRSRFFDMAVSHRLPACHRSGANETGPP